MTVKSKVISTQFTIANSWFILSWQPIWISSFGISSTAQLPLHPLVKLSIKNLGGSPLNGLLTICLLEIWQMRVRDLFRWLHLLEWTKSTKGYNNNCQATN